MLPGVFDRRELRRPARGDRRVFDDDAGRTGARGQGRVPLRAAQPQRRVPGGGRAPARPRGDRTAARRGLPRHRQHRVAQPGRLRGRPVALRRGPAHPAARGHRRGTTASRIPCSRSAPTSISRTARVADGPTAIVPGSHRSGRLAPFDRMYDPDLTYDGRPPVLIEADAGDVALFVSDAWHRGLPADRGWARPLLLAGALRPPRHRATDAHDRSGEPPLARSDRAGQDGTSSARSSACTIRSSTTPDPPACPPTTKNASRCSSTTRTSPSARAKRWAASPLDFRPIADALAERGRVVVRRAYADWSRFAEDRRELTRHHVELIEIPQRMGAIRKNAADIKMAVDAIELSFERDYITTFVLGTGDSDFTPLVHKLRELNRRVIGIGIEASTSALLPPACDEFLFYERLEGVEPIAPKRASRRAGPPEADAGRAARSRRDTTPTPTHRRNRRGPREADLGVLVTQTLSGLERSTGGPVLASMLKRTILRKDPTFSETTYGFRGFVELLRHLAERGVVELGEGTNTGDPTVSFPTQADERDAAFALLRSVVDKLAAKAPAAPVGPEEPAAQGAARLQREALRLRRLPAVRQGRGAARASSSSSSTTTPTTTSSARVPTRRRPSIGSAACALSNADRRRRRSGPTGTLRRPVCRRTPAPRSRGRHRRASGHRRARSRCAGRGTGWRGRTGCRSRRCSPARRRCTTRHVSRNTTPGTGTAARPVSMRISSLAGSELRSPTRIAGNDRGRHSRTNSHSARTCSWRTPLWSSRQLRCAQNTWIGPRGPAISANTASRSSPSSSAAPAPFAGQRAYDRGGRWASVRSPRCRRARRPGRSGSVPTPRRRTRAPRPAARPGCACRRPTPLAGR